MAENSIEVQIEASLKASDRNARVLSLFSLFAVFSVSVVSFVLSYSPLRALAQDSGIPHAYLFPFAVDGIMVVASVSTLLSAVRERKSQFSTLVLYGSVVTSIFFNVQASGLSSWLVDILYSVAPISLALSIHLFSKDLEAEIFQKRSQLYAKLRSSYNNATDSALEDLSRVNSELEEKVKKLSSIGVVPQIEVGILEESVFVKAFRSFVGAVKEGKEITLRRVNMLNTKVEMEYPDLGLKFSFNNSDRKLVLVYSKTLPALVLKLMADSSLEVIRE